MKKGWKIAGTAVGLALILTAAIGTTAFADDGDVATDTVTCPAYDGVNGGGYGWHGANGMGEVSMDTVVGLTGLTEEEIQALRYEGQSLAQIAEAKGVSTDALVAAIMTQKTAELQVRVTEGTLTQEQADLMLQLMEQRTLQMVTRTTTGPAEWSGANGAGGYGMCGGGFASGTESQVRGRGGAGMMARGSGLASGICDGTGTGTPIGSANKWGGATH